MAPKRILVIAGSDSSGGAGLEADQKVIAAHGCYAMTATTALTAQNTLGVQDIHHTPPEFVRKQIDAVCDDVGVDVVKTGMLASAETIEIVADALRRHNISTSIVDPVMVSTSGSQLLPETAVSTLIKLLLPLTTLLTPNLPEAKLLLQTTRTDVTEPQNVDDIVALAHRIRELGPKWVLLKGGHLPLTRGRVYIEAGIKTAVDIGSGNGPINHFHSVYMLPFISGNFISYLLDREEVQKPWKEYTQHEFVQRMGDGTLPVEKFMYYLVQDYLFLVQFSRATALSAYKSSNLQDIGMSVQQVVTLQEEIKLHINFCKEYGLSETDIINTEEDQATTAYTRYVLDIGMSQDWLALQIALLPCLIGYSIIAKRLYEDPSSVRIGSRYWIWIEQYVADEYRQAMMRGSELVEKHAEGLSASRVEELAKIFVHATNMERGFWDMGLRSGELQRRSQVMDQTGTSRDHE
ncbi:hypothetical protein PTNB73_08073 [Pyrenophora teres f. teres]|nr:hypothetical protein PTNB73_08073 [Pyrenophora teres f. teres]